MCFVVLAADFHKRCARSGLLERAGAHASRLRVPLTTLYVSVTLIFVRTVYRIVEYFGLAAFKIGAGVDPNELSAVVRHEWFFYVFESLLMLTNVGMFNVWHPMRYLPRNHKIYLASDGITEVEGPGWADRRPLWQTLLDPFDISSMLGQKGKKEKFWQGQSAPVGEREEQVTRGEQSCDKTSAV